MEQRSHASVTDSASSWRTRAPRGEKVGGAVDIRKARLTGRAGDVKAVQPVSLDKATAMNNPTEHTPQFALFREHPTLPLSPLCARVSDLHVFIPVPAF